MARFPYQYANINGIPCIKTQTVVVSDTAVTFKFAPDFDGRPFRGLILVYISCYFVIYISYSGFSISISSLEYVFERMYINAN